MLNNSTLRIYLERHGEPQFPSSASFIYGWTDYPLSLRGQEQAHAAADALSSVRLDRIVSSDLSRAAQTASAAAAAQRTPVSVEMMPGLREMNMGDWDGKRVDEIGREAEDMFGNGGWDDITSWRVPGGETFSQLRDRALASFRRITESSANAGNTAAWTAGERADEKNILITAHGGTLWAIISSLFGLNPGDMGRFPQSHCGIHVIELRGCRGTTKDTAGELFSLIRWNWTPTV